MQTCADKFFFAFLYYAELSERSKYYAQHQKYARSFIFHLPHHRFLPEGRRSNIIALFLAADCVVKILLWIAISCRISAKWHSYKQRGLSKKKTKRIFENSWQCSLNTHSRIQIKRLIRYAKIRTLVPLKKLSFHYIDPSWLNHIFLIFRTYCMWVTTTVGIFNQLISPLSCLCYNAKK